MRTIPEAIVRDERIINSLSSNTKPNERLMMGDIRGAMIIAPMIVGALLTTRPNVAMKPERANMR